MSQKEIDEALYGKRKSKYGVDTSAKGKEDRTADNICFHSKAEMKRYLYLKQMQSAGVILRLELQPAFALRVNGSFICSYVADFSYYALDGKRVIEDVKGVRTPIFRIKARLLEALTGLRVMET